MASVATNCVIRFNEDNTVRVGSYEIPYGEPIRAEIVDNSVQLWTEDWTMGLEEGCFLNFSFERAKEVAAFVRGLLRKTSVFFLLVHSIQPTFEGGRWKIELSCASEKMNWIFHRFIAPVIFPECRVSFDGRDKIVFYTARGERGTLVEKLKKGFAWLDRHANNSVYDALFLCPELRIAKGPRKVENYCGKQSYVITPRSVLKAEGTEWKSLSSSPREAEDLKKGFLPLLRQIEGFAEKHNQGIEELGDFLYEAKRITAKDGPKDVVGVEVLKNLLGCQMHERVKAAKEKIWQEIVDLEAALHSSGLFTPQGAGN